VGPDRFELSTNGLRVHFLPLGRYSKNPPTEGNAFTLHPVSITLFH
jgi:hypothetical protein